MFKLCLMAAGRGTRNNNFLNLHKALLPLANRPVISYILDCVDPDVEVVIALGHLSDQLQSYLEFVYPDRNFTFVEVDKYQGPGAGPGYSLLQCRPHLDCPFIFTSIDTLFDTKLETPEGDWVGVQNVDDPTGYCCVDIGPNEIIRKFHYPTEGKSAAFIGIAGIYDHEQFWSSLSDTNTINNEHQVINGFSQLNMTTRHFDWHDTGTNAAYLETKKHYSQPITATKRDEALFIDHNKVVKFFSDDKKVAQRFERAGHLHPHTPTITKLSNHLYGYDFVIGNTLAHNYDERLLDQFFEFCDQFFRPVTDWGDEGQFKDNCWKMYYEKTTERVQAFQGTELDAIEIINGIKVKPIASQIDAIDWPGIVSKAIPFRFHGDFQPENIILNWSGIRLLDWRDSFGDDVEIGDLYYDLGKLHHALMVNGTNIMMGKYSVDIRDTQAFLNVDVRYNLLMVEQRLEKLCVKRGLDYQHVQLLSTLQYITIASLYEDNPQYRAFLFLFGKMLLAKC